MQHKYVFKQKNVILFYAIELYSMLCDTIDFIIFINARTERLMVKAKTFIFVDKYQNLKVSIGWLKSELILFQFSAQGANYFAYYRDCSQF